MPSLSPRRHRLHQSHSAPILSLLMLALLFTCAAPQCRSNSSPTSQPTLLSAVPSTLTGGLIFTKESEIYLIDIQTLKTRRTWTYAKPLRFAVPLEDGKRFLIVSGKRSEGPVNLSLFTPGANDIAIASAVDIGLPTVSPDGSKVAWIMEQEDGKTSLNIASLADVAKTRTLAGKFAVDNAGPRWAGERPADTKFIVALSTKEIATVEFDKNKTTPLCRGELPLLLTKSQEILFTRDRHLWKLDISQKSEADILEIGYIAAYYRSCLAIGDGRHLAYHTKAVVRNGGFRHMSYPTIGLVDLNTRSMAPIWQTIRFCGPWAWLPDRHTNNERCTTRPTIERSSETAPAQ